MGFSLFNNLEGQVDGYSKKDVFVILCQMDSELGLFGSGKKHCIMDITSVELVDPIGPFTIDDVSKMMNTTGGWDPNKFGVRGKHFHKIKYSWYTGYMMASDSVNVDDLTTKLRDIKLNNIGI